MKTVKGVKKDKDGKIIAFNFGADAANDDWIRAGRLARKAKAGDKQAKKELQELEATNMVTYSFEELNDITDGLLEDWP